MSEQRYPTKEQLEAALEIAQVLHSTQGTQFQYMLNMHIDMEALRDEVELWKGIALRKDTDGELHEHVPVKRGHAMCPSAYCEVCGEALGWWCPDSPTHVCDYEQEDGSYDEDQCRYCGEPEERK